MFEKNYILFNLEKIKISCFIVSGQVEIFRVREQKTFSTHGSAKVYYEEK